MPAFAQHAPSWTVTDGSNGAVIGDSGTVTFQGDSNIHVAQSGADDAGVIEITLGDDIDLGADGSVTIGDTRVDNTGVAIGSNVVLDNAGLTISAGPSVTAAGIDAGGKVITGVASGTASDHAVNFGQLSTVSAAASVAQSTATNAAAAAAAAQIAADAAGWIISDGATTTDIGSGGTVTFQGDGNISVALTGVNDDGKVTVTLDENLTVTSITAGNATLDNGGLTFSSGGPSVTASGIDAGGLRITGLAEGALTATSSDAVSGKQIFDLFIEEGAGGVRYFRARSAQPDSQAMGDESIAIGPNTVAEGVSSFAAGDGAATTASAESAIAIGQGATAGGELTGGEAAIAIGRDSEATGNSSVALGDNANAGGANATALGARAAAGGAGGVALGQDAVAAATNNISIGNAAGQGTGQVLPGDQSHNIAIGNQSGQNVAGQFNVAMGDGAGSNVDGDDNVAMGRGAGVGIAGEQNVSIGLDANSGVTSNRAVGIGQSARAETEGVAVGFNASAGNTGVALGRQTTALGTGTAIGPNAHADSNFVALGLNSWATQSDVSGSSEFTNRTFNGSAVSVGSSQSGASFTRRIVNVEDGANDTDAVNVRQLKQAVSGIDLSDIDFAGGVIANLQDQIDQNMLNYVSINDGGIDKGNKNNNGADAAAVDSVAIGPDATTKNRDSIAIGHQAGAEGDSAVVLGHNIKGLGKNSTTIGNSQSEALGESGIAIGTRVESRDQNSIVIGRDSYTNRQASGPAVDNSIVIGTQSSSTAVEGIVIGKDSLVNAPRGIAQGSGAHSTASDATALGTRASASAASAQASGTDARASGVNAIATGTGATGWANDGIAMGTGAVSGFNDPANLQPRRNMGGVAIGQSTLADNYHALAIGVEARATDESATAIGDAAEASAEDALAIGSSARASAENAAAFGQDATAEAENALAVGSGARASARNASAFGQGAQASHAGSVALGSGAITAAPIGTASISVDKNTYNFAGTSPVATVSVGAAGAERTLTNLAAGRISATSTDGINGSQLHGTNMALESLADDLDAAGDSIADVLGGNAVYDPNTHQVTMSNVGGTGKGTVHDAIEYAAQGWAVAANGEVTGANVAPGGSVDFSNTDSNIIIARDGTDLTFDLAENIDLGANGSLTTGDTVVNNDGLAVDDGVGNSTTVGAGAIAVTDAAGTTTIGGNEISVGGANPIVINGDAGTIGGLTNTTFDPNAPYTGGIAATQEQLGQVNNDLTAAGLDFVGDDGRVVHRDLGEQLSITGGATGTLSEGNIGVTRNADEDGLVIELADNIALTEDGSLAIGDGADGSTLDADGLAVVDGDNETVVGAGTIAVTDAAGTTTIGGNEISVGGANPIVINGDAGTVGGLTNTTFDPNNYTSGQAATEDQLKQVSDVANAGWNVSAQGANATNVGVNSPTGNSVDLNNADGNIVITKADDSNDVTFDLAENIDLGANGSLTTGDTVVNNDGLAVDDGVGNSTTVGAGTIAVTDTDGTTTIGGNEISVGGANPIVINGDAGTIGGLTNTTFDPNAPYTGGIAATQEQLGQVNNDLTAAGLDFVGDDGRVVHRDLGEQLSITGGATGTLSEGNIGVTRNADEDGLVIELADNIALTEDGSLAIGDGADGSTLNADGLAVVDGDNETVVGAGTIAVTDDAGTTTIGGNEISVGGANPIVINGDAGTVGGLTNTTFDPNNYTSGQAATEDQLKQVSDVANAGWNVSAQGANATNVGVNSPTGNSVDLNNADGNIVITKADDSNDVTFDLAENIDLGANGSLTTGDTVVNNDGLAVDDGAGKMASLTVEGASVSDDEGNVTTLAADGTTVENADGNSTVVGAGSVAVTDAAGTTTIGGGAIVVGGASPILISGNAGTISGLQNQTINYPGFADGSGRAATEEQLVLVNQTATAGWNLTGAGVDQVNIGPNGSVDFQGDQNITVAQTGDDQDGVIAVTLNRDVDVDSVTVGDTAIDTSGVAVGGDVHLGNTGLVINGGPSVTMSGIDAGTLVITNVAAGDVSATSTDAINGSQLHGMGQSIVNVIGGNAGLNPDGTITTSDIGGTGHDNIDDAIRSANEAANAGWTATDANGNDANIGPNGTVNFTGDQNITVAQTGADNRGQIEITLNRDLDVDSLTAGDTVVDTDGVHVGDDVHLGDTGLVIEGGPSVTTDGVDAGGQVIGNVAAGVADTDAANVGQLNDLASSIVDNSSRVTNLEEGATGPFQVSQEAPIVPPTPTGANSAAGGSGADASGDNSTALGNQAVAAGSNSTAVGQGAKATHDNSVALGQGSATTVGAQSGYDAAYVGTSNSSGEVNVGNRTISGVAPGVAGNDAVNVNQLSAGVDHAVVTANNYTDQRFSQIHGDVWDLGQRIDGLERDLNAGIATAMSMRQAPYVAGATTYYAGFGAYKGEGAVGVSLRRTADNGRWSLEGGFSSNREGTGGYVGVSGVLGGK
ncbi:hypothetical protein [Lysobacter sp. H21R4]|uniref:beta strand repeat-containing protein n=1 Tax=Lysobacter sp. H21R4 TaxID=2781021 RepID=UPI001E49E3B5|nr:hypothetical protein [Lysobacter sp. H21R4]